MSDDIVRYLDPLTPFTQVIATMTSNDRILDGKIEDLDFNTGLIDQIYDVLSIEKQYEIGLELGHTLSDYSDWTHFDAETGYSIWKYPVSNFKDNTTNQMLLDNVLLDYRGEADIEAQVYFDKVKRYDSTQITPAFVNLTTAVQNEGSSSEILSAVNDYLYMGHATKFSTLAFELDVAGNGHVLTLEYWNGAAWTEISTFTDNTTNMSENGTITYTEPGDWATTAVDGDTIYWVRLDTSVTPVGAPEVKTITRGNAIADIMLMTGTQIQDKDWPWCYYNGYVYAAIKNDDTSTAYEGNTYITSTSSEDNKKNYFITNHLYSLNHEKAVYSSGISFTFDEELIIDLTLQTGDAGNNAIRVLPGDGYTYAEFRLGHNDVDAITTELRVVRLNDDTTPVWEYGDIHCQNIIAEGDVLSGDLVFNNGVRFIEDGPNIYMVNAAGKEIFRINDNGDVVVKGKLIVEKE